MIDILQYHDDDLQSLTELMTDLDYPTTLDKMRDRMELIKSTTGYYTFMALRDNKVVGMIGCRDVYYYEGDGIATQISALVTKKDFQGQGIGKALVTFVEQWAKDRGANSLFLTSGIKPERKKAHEFYKTLGFEINGYRFVKTLKA